MERGADAEPVYTVSSAAVDDESNLAASLPSSDPDCNCKSKKPKITYGPEQIVKGKPETYIHHQPKIIVRQPPTHVRIEHPPTVIQPSTIVIRRNGKTIRRPVIYQHLPRDVQVRPVYIKVVRPIEKNVIVENKSQQGQVIESKDLEYETTYGGRTYSESFDEEQQEAVDIPTSKPVVVKADSNEYEYGAGHSYSASYEQQEQEAVSIQKSKKVEATVESNEYDTLYGGDAHSYSASYAEQQQEALDYEKSKQVAVEVDSNDYDNLYGTGHSYSGSYEEQEHEALAVDKLKQIQESYEEHHS